jgi:hypothetical protein
MQAPDGSTDCAYMADSWFHGFCEFSVFTGSVYMTRFREYRVHQHHREHGLYVVVLSEPMCGKIVVPITSSCPGYGSCKPGNKLVRVLRVSY